ncbi:PBSX family phage terminase large subunit, partial [Streptococcus gordonii]|nr:PBSX family phage terminase large subunit [Streptococcus gordonii]
KKDKKTNEYINEPVYSYNHCIDAIRYALQDRIYQTKKVVNVDKAISKINKMFRR